MFFKSQSLKAHILIHTGDKPNTCDTCSKCVTRLSCLKAYILLHTGDKLYTCDTCSKCFTHLSSLKAHNSFIQEISLMLVTLVLNVLLIYLA